jgi:K+-transporting ATPase KdpF subunit
MMGVFEAVTMTAITIAVLIYLLYALLQPERF